MLCSLRALVVIVGSDGRMLLRFALDLVLRRARWRHCGHGPRTLPCCKRRRLSSFWQGLCSLRAFLVIVGWDRQQCVGEARRMMQRWSCNSLARRQRDRGASHRARSSGVGSLANPLSTARSADGMRRSLKRGNAQSARRSRLCPIRIQSAMTPCALDGISVSNEAFAPGRWVALRVEAAHNEAHEGQR